MFDHVEVSIPCSKCGLEAKKTVAWVKANDHLICACGARTEIDTSNFLRELDKSQKALDEFRRKATQTIKIGL